MQMNDAVRHALFDVPVVDTRPRRFTAIDGWRLFFRYWPLCALCMLMVGGIVGWGASRQPLLYTAQSQLLIKMDQGSPSLLSGVAAYRESMGQEPPARRIETEMTLLRKRSSVERVITQLAMQPADFRQSTLSLAIAPLREAWHAWRPPSTAPRDTPPADPLAETYRAFDASLVIEPVRSKSADVTSNVVEIRLTGTDPVRTRDALAALLHAYHALDAAQSDLLIQRAADVLRAQTNDAAAELYRSEQEYVRFSTGAAAATLAGQALKLPGDVTGPAVPPPTAKLRSDLQELQTRLDTLRETYTDRHEAVRTLRDAIDKLRTRMLQETRDMVRASVNVEMLDRRRNQAQARYTELQRKLDQIELLFQIDLSSVESRLNTETPRAAEPVGRGGQWLTMAAGPLIGLALGLLIAAVREAFDRRLRSPEDVREAVGLEVLAIVPERVRASRGRR